MDLKLKKSCEAGYSLMGLLVGFGISSIVVALMASSLFEITRRVHDEVIISDTEQTAQSLRDFVATELRITGAGMPIGQSSFVPGTVGLDNAPLPLLTPSDNEHIELRLSKMGRTFVLTTEFDPDGGDQDFQLVSSEELEEEDIIYISNLPSGGDEGFRGSIDDVTGNTVNIESTYWVSAGATFPTGSVMTVVEDITYDSPDDWSGVTRTSSEGTILVAPNTAFTLEYLDASGASIPLPLTEDIIRDDLTAVRLQVFARSKTPLRNGSIYTAEAEQVVTLRNLILGRNT